MFGPEIFMHPRGLEPYPIAKWDSAQDALQSDLGRPNSSKFDEIPDRLLQLLTSSAVRKGSREQMQSWRCFAEFWGAINACVQLDKPVQLTLMAFPFKVPNPAKVGTRLLPDLAEYAALLRLRHLREVVKIIYPPGLEIHLIHDGSYIAGVFGVPLEEVRQYERYFARLVDSLGPERFIHLHDFKTLSRTEKGEQKRQAARLRELIRCCEQDGLDGKDWIARFSKTLGMINLRNFSAREACQLLHHAKGGRLPPEHSDLEQRVRVAMRRYSFRDLMLHAFDPRPLCFPHAIHATTQSRPGRLAIWMIDRGRSLLPWHGVGVVDHAGKWKVVQAHQLSASYRPVFLDGEDTPFFYRQEA